MDRRNLLIGAGLALFSAGCARVTPEALGSATAAPTAASLIVGSDGTPVGAVLAALYAAALSSQGVPAATAPSPVALEQAVPALRVGTVDVLPAYASSLLAAVAPGDEPPVPDEVATTLATVLDPEVVVLRAVGVDGRLIYATAPESGLASLAELRGMMKKGTLVGPGWLASAPDGPVGLKAIYAADFAAVHSVADARQRAELIQEGAALVGAFRAPELPPGSGLTVLADPELLVAADPQVVLVTPEVARSDAAVLAIDAVQEALTTEVLASLAGRVAGGSGADEVAREWLGGMALG